jgi:RNA polymerase sigma-70 factor, ECF subfamily
MSRDAALAAAFQNARPRLVRIAYAVLGSHAEAEDAVSETWLKLAAADRVEAVRDVDAWATVAVARTALDAARSARMRREVYPGPWLPEPIIEGAAGRDDPADRITLDDTVSYALLVVLETLTPAERTAWVLHDLFAMTFIDVAAAVGRSPAAVRQLATRARKHIEAGIPRVPVHPTAHAAAVQRFLDAALGGDLDTLVSALDPDVLVVSDGGGEVQAARRPIKGSAAVARFLYGITRTLNTAQQMRLLTINGEPGLGIFEADGQLTTVAVLTVTDERITRIDFIRAPAKLAAAQARFT